MSLQSIHIALTHDGFSSYQHFVDTGELTGPFRSIFVAHFDLRKESERAYRANPGSLDERMGELVRSRDHIRKLLYDTGVLHGELTSFQDPFVRIKSHL